MVRIVVALVVMDWIALMMRVVGREERQIRREA
jgi:hypothetical protein